MKTGRKITSGKYKKARKKKKYELAGEIRKVFLGKEKRKAIRVRGGNSKVFMLTSELVNVLNTKTHKSQKTKIKNVIETPSNRFLARQNILVKGAIIETELGKARITNRPSQEGNVQAVLIE